MENPLLMRWKRAEKKKKRKIIRWASILQAKMPKRQWVIRLFFLLSNNKILPDKERHEVPFDPPPSLFVPLMKSDGVTRDSLLSHLWECTRDNHQSKRTSFPKCDTPFPGYRNGKTSSKWIYQLSEIFTEFPTTCHSGVFLGKSFSSFAQVEVLH